MNFINKIESFLNRHVLNYKGIIIVISASFNFLFAFHSGCKTQPAPIVYINKPLDSIAPSILKMNQYPNVKTMGLVKGYKGIFQIVDNNEPIYSFRTIWNDTEVILLNRLSNEKQERSYSVTNETPLPFTLVINTKTKNCLLEIDNKNDTMVHVRSFIEEI